MPLESGRSPLAPHPVGAARALRRAALWWVGTWPVDGREEARKGGTRNPESHGWNIGCARPGRGRKVP